ncbi:hypothetical protein CEC96047_18670 [Escherichia coli]|nr:hypothetical protein CEC96047_18670 [Escherichia coli]
MPFSFNLSSGNYLSTQDVEVLQRATRDHQMERLTIGERSFSVRYQSAKGRCYDNARAESFFHSLKVECIYG